MGKEETKVKGAVMKAARGPGEPVGPGGGGAGVSRRGPRRGDSVTQGLVGDVT